jgi:hypothetical protein
MRERSTRQGKQRRPHKHQEEVTLEPEAAGVAVEGGTWPERRPSGSSVTAERLDGGTKSR